VIQDGKCFLRLSREDPDWLYWSAIDQGFNIISGCPDYGRLRCKNSKFIYHDFAFCWMKTRKKPAITSGNDINDYNCLWLLGSYWLPGQLCWKKGMPYWLFLPAWGEYVIPREDRLLFKTAQQAYNYGWFIRQPLQKQLKNIVWMLGGDRLPDERKDGVRSLACHGWRNSWWNNGEKNMNGKADYSTTCMTYHSFSSSSQWFHNDDWIDFHSWGSYHSDF